MREYFYGKRSGTSYFPYSFDVAFSEVQLFKIGGMYVSWCDVVVVGSSVQCVLCVYCVLV